MVVARVGGGGGELRGQRLEVGATAQGAGGRGRSAEIDGAVGAPEHSPGGIEDFRSREDGPDPRRRGTLGPEPMFQRLGAARVARTGMGRQQQQRAGLCFRVPGLNRRQGRRVAHQDGVDPVAQQALGELGVGLGGPHEVAQRAQDGVAELLPGGEQGRRSRGQADPVALQFLERMAAGARSGPPPPRRSAAPPG